METIRKGVPRVPVLVSVPRRNTPVRMEAVPAPRANKVYVWRSLVLRPDEFEDIVAAGRRRPPLNRGR
ncbi:MAG: hypothetical protein JST54_16275 [Deltaproteobacteria bacterium]|nr:hypothetical protein [Deltaproteobacteria bacterium]